MVNHLWQKSPGEQVSDGPGEVGGLIWDKWPENDFSSPRSPPHLPSMTRLYFPRSAVGTAAGGRLVQTLSSHRSHVDTLFSAQMQFSEQHTTWGSSGGCFSLPLSEVLGYVMEGTTGTQITDKCFCGNWNYRQIWMYINCWWGQSWLHLNWFCWQMIGSGVSSRINVFVNVAKTELSQPRHQPVA